MDWSEESYSERHEIYFQNLPAWPSFEAYDKNIDGLLPSARLETWEQFHELVKSYRTEGSEYIFRGQHNYRWSLQPTLDRMTSGAISEEIARKQLRNFRLSIRGRVRDNTAIRENEEELWAVGQHHGLATPLLDWTLAPYVALFFAFVNEDFETWVDEYKNHSRAVYILNKSFIEDLIQDKDSDPLESGYPKIVEPSKDDHGRLVNQAGLFTIAPYGETIESALLKALVDSDVDVDDPNEVSKYICKIHIPNSAEIRRDCLRHLRKMNIHHASLFPDVIGASGYCNELISEYISLSGQRHVEESKELLPTNEPEAAVTVSGLEKDFVVTESDDTFKMLIRSLIINENIKVSESSIKKVVKSALAFVDEKVGVDWFVRESQLSRLNIFVRRSLKKTQFPDDFIEAAAISFVDSIAKISKERDREERIKKGSLIDLPKSESIFKNNLPKN